MNLIIYPIVFQLLFSLQILLIIFSGVRSPTLHFMFVTFYFGRWYVLLYNYSHSIDIHRIDTPIVLT